MSAHGEIQLGLATAFAAGVFATGRDSHAPNYDRSYARRLSTATNAVCSGVPIWRRASAIARSKNSLPVLLPGAVNTLPERPVGANATYCWMSYVAFAPYYLRGKCSNWLKLQRIQKLVKFALDKFEKVWYNQDRKQERRRQETMEGKKLKIREARRMEGSYAIGPRRAPEFGVGDAVWFKADQEGKGVVLRVDEKGARNDYYIGPTHGQEGVTERWHPKAFWHPDLKQMVVLVDDDYLWSWQI